jgi:RNA polymerase sigma factor (sigma-70 family)
VVEVDRLQEALRAGEEAELEPAARRAVADAREAWDRAQALRWELAVSAAEVVPREARRVANASGMDVSDLVNEGYIGLLRAAVRFDPDRGVRFRSSARWWARAQRPRAVDGGGRTVRLSGAAVEQLRNLQRARTARERTGEAYTVADLAGDAGVTPARAEELLSRPSVVSLDTPVNDDPDGQLLGDGISSAGSDAETEAASAELVARLRDALEALPDERCRYVVRRRYGIDDGTPRTLVEIGDELGLSRERVRQIEAQAVRWLREEGGLLDRERSAA